MAILLESVEQLALNAVRVTFTEEPKRFNENDAVDSLHRANYELVSKFPSVQVVVADESPFAVVVFFDQPLPAPAEDELQVQGVEDVTGATTVPTTALPLTTFAEELPPTAEASLRGRFDIANPQTVRDAGGGPLGTFQVTESGDLGNDTGRTNLRKRVFRRISTRPGGFFHLPNYGVRQKDKTLMTPTALRDLQLSLESQITSEPDVVNARVRVSEITPGVVRVKVRVQDALGPFEMEAALDLTGDSDA